MSQNQSITIRYASNRQEVEQVKVCQRSPMRKRLILAFVASVITSIATPSFAAQPVQPKLVVGIVVDDLRTEYLTLLKEQFAEGGFKKLMKDGVFITAADFGAAVDPAAATAIIYTGASPSVNGVPAEEIFDRTTLRGIPVFTDNGVLGNYTSQNLSPKSLTVTTISDEVRVSGGGVTCSYAIAPESSKAIIMAGHAGNCGVWLNNANESWATTTYYKDAPSTLNGRNRLQPLKVRVDTMSWTPLYQRAKYSMVPEHITKYPFRYTFRQQQGPQKMLEFTNSPKVNQEVTEFAIATIRDLYLGKHSGSDMISVGYTLEPFAYSKMADNRYELFDAYYRLDQNLAQLFSAIDKQVGLSNTLIFLAGTPASQRVKRDDEKWNLPYGEFSTRKAISLLNLYLIAKYGNGDYVQAYHNNQFFLNRPLIEQKSLSLEEVSKDCARFLEKMSGITKAYSLDEIIVGKTTDTAPLKRSISIEHAGDIWISVIPGWQIIDDFNTVAHDTNQVVRYTAATAPAFILSPNIQSQKITTPVDARAIAPTITSILRIRSPNAASEAPLNLE